MSRTDRITAILLVIPTALLGGALGFQYLGGLHPCEMCLWQRYALVATIGIGLAAWVAGRNRVLLVFAALAVLTDAAIAAFHAGVERHWWEGFTTCSASKVSGSTADIVAAMLAAPVVRCDAVAWSLFSISMAGWNAIIAGATGAWALWQLSKA